MCRILLAVLIAAIPTQHGDLDTETVLLDRYPFQAATASLANMERDIQEVHWLLQHAYLKASIGIAEDAVICTREAARTMQRFLPRYGAVADRLREISAANPDAHPLTALVERMNILLYEAEFLEPDTRAWLEVSEGLRSIPISEWQSAFAPLLLRMEENMALPRSGYDVLTVPNPSADLTDFSFLIDSRSLSAAWRATCDTTDGTRARFATHPGGTELAFDAVYYDSGDGYWIFRVKYAGVVGSTGVFKIRCYPPTTRNTAYAEGDTYGSDNAYDSYWQGYWPLQGNFNDRTANDRDGTGQGGISAGDIAGKLGKGTNFDGVGDYITLGDVLGGVTQPMTFMCWLKSNTTLGTLMGMRDGTNYQWQFFTGSGSVLVVNSYSYANVPASTNILDNAWRQVGGSVTGTTITFYEAGESDGTGNFSASDRNVAALIGARYATAPSVAALYTGGLQEVSVHSTNRSAAWWAHEYSQVNNNASFWGTPTWIGAISRPFTQVFVPAGVGAF